MSAAWLLKALGGGLLFLAGTGAGMAAWQRRRERWGQAQCFCRLLAYLLDAVRYQALPARDILAMAACSGAFPGLGLEGCPCFSRLPIPPALDDLFPELQAGLCALESAPRASACQTLEYLLEQCRAAEQKAQQEAARARTLYPRLGACLGILGAILLL